MNDWLIIIGSACASVYFVLVLRGYLPIKKAIWPRSWARRRLKPLDCEHCLAFWLAIFFSISGDFFYKNLQNLPYIGVTAAVLAILISKQISK